MRLPQEAVLSARGCLTHASFVKVCGTANRSGSLLAVLRGCRPAAPCTHAPAWQANSSVIIIVRQVCDRGASKLKAYMTPGSGASAEQPVQASGEQHERVRTPGTYGQLCLARLAWDSLHRRSAVRPGQLIAHLSRPRRRQRRAARRRALGCGALPEHGRALRRAPSLGWAAGCLNRCLRPSRPACSPRQRAPNAPPKAAAQGLPRSMWRAAQTARAPAAPAAAAPDPPGGSPAAPAAPVPAAVTAGAACWRRHLPAGRRFRRLRCQSDSRQHWPQLRRRRERQSPGCGSRCLPARQALHSPGSGGTAETAWTLPVQDGYAAAAVAAEALATMKVAAPAALAALAVRVRQLPLLQLLQPKEHLQRRLEAQLAGQGPPRSPAAAPAGHHAWAASMGAPLQRRQPHAQPRLSQALLLCAGYLAVVPAGRRLVRQQPLLLPGRASSSHCQQAAAVGAAAAAAPVELPAAAPTPV